MNPQALNFGFWFFKTKIRSLLDLKKRKVFPFCLHKKAENRQAKPKNLKKVINNSINNQKNDFVCSLCVEKKKAFRMIF